jgi:hypothetical protein
MGKTPAKLRINATPTGVTANRGAHTPDECHKALTAENRSYVNITQKPSWVRDPLTYQPGSSSSISVSFEDPDGTSAQALLRSRTLYMFGHVVTVKRRKQSLPKLVTAFGASRVTPSAAGKANAATSLDLFPRYSYGRRVPTSKTHFTNSHTTPEKLSRRSTNRVHSI